MTTDTTEHEVTLAVPRWRDPAALWYVGGVLVGAVLIIWAAINQPYNQNELLQVAPYGSDNIAEIVNGTRQPPLGPLLGGIFWHLFGEGQLRQRLVPVLSGIGTLIVMSLLLRRLRLGGAGAVGIWVLATAPLMVRYSAYTRPYALPLFLMVVFVYAAQRWLDDRRRGWLVLAAVAAGALPLARVPEPTVFLLTTVVILGWLAVRGRFKLAEAAPLMAIALGALVVVGYPMSRTLASEAPGLFDPSLSGVLGRLDGGVVEMVSGMVPLLASWLPWWPITALVVVAALALPASRQQLARWWFLWPLLAAPVAFALAYHFLSTVSFDNLPYRSRAAYFFIAPYVLVVVALASALAQTRAAVSQRIRIGVAVPLLGALLGQLPATAKALLYNDAPDFAQAAEVIAARVPPDGVVLYDRPEQAPQGRSGFFGESRYLGDQASVIGVRRVPNHPGSVPRDSPVYLLINGQCVEPVRCTPLSYAEWAEPVPGWEVAARFDRFTLYEPVAGQSGRVGASEALGALGQKLGPDHGYMETYAAAALLEMRGRTEQGKELITQMFAAASRAEAERIRYIEEENDLNPFEDWGPRGDFIAQSDTAYTRAPHEPTREEV